MNDSYSSNYFKSYNGFEKLYFQKFDFGNGKKVSNKKQVIAVHDAGLYHNQYEKLIESIDGQDVSFYCLDLKGHGLSSGSRNQIDDLNECSLDLASLINIKAVIKEGPLYLMGSGLGATLILNLLFFHSNILKRKIDGIILVNPVFNYGPKKPNVVKILSSFIKKKNNFKVSYSQTGYDLTDELSCAERYNSDPLVDFTFPLSFIDEINNIGQRVVNFSYFIDLPTLLLSSNDDYRKFELSVRPELLTHLSYSGKKRDILNDKQRKKCFNDIMNWLRGS